MTSDYATVAELLARTVRVHADRPALVAGDRTWTFAELERCVIGGAARLAEGSVGPGRKVALIGANHPAYVVGFFAAQWLGATTLEASRHEALETLKRLLDDASPAMVLTDRRDLLAALEGSCPVQSFDAFLAAAQESGEEDRVRHRAWSRVTSGSPASVVYTSGTTGSPKGVVLSHANFSAVTGAILDYLELTPDDRYGLVLPLFHSYGKSNLLTSFAAGASLVMLDEFRDLSRFLDSLSGHGCTVVSLVPYHANMLLRRANLAGRDLSHWRAATFSGNHLPWETIDGLRRELPDLRIFSMYGLTESTTRACYVPPERLVEKRGSCGRPIRGVELRITGEDGSLLPARQTGEVWIRGPNVMQGYYNDPELTRETLIDGWLRTGDLGWLDEDGYLYLAGRKKDIIKCAGERISAFEIESVLCSHPDVVEAAVVGAPDPILGEAVRAFVVLRGNLKDLSALRKHCARNLSHHKLPRRYEVLDELPKTASGKVKKHLLGAKGHE